MVDSLNKDKLRLDIINNLPVFKELIDNVISDIGIAHYVGIDILNKLANVGGLD